MKPLSCKGCTVDAVDISVEAVLLHWRRKTIDIFMASSVLVYLPAIVLMLLGYGPPIPMAVKWLMYLLYFVLVLSAFLRDLHPRIRLFSMLGMAYLFSIVGGISFPGPFMRVLPVILPIIGLILCGIRCGRILAGLSVVVIVTTPMLSTLPFFVRNLQKSTVLLMEPDIVLVQDFGLIATLLTMIVLLERYYQFLGKALVDQHQAISDVEHKVTELTKAHSTLAKETAQRRQLEQEITRIADEEKRGLGLEIHDGVCQQITGALLRCEALDLRLKRGQAATADDIRALSSLLEDAIDEAHGVAKGLCPLDASPNAIEVALRTFTRRTQRISGISCRFITSGDVEIFDLNKAQHLFRIAQEAVSNAVRHAQSTQINVGLHLTAHDIVLQVKDNGQGVPAVLPTSGMGLHTMACRAHLLEGELTVVPVSTGGTMVRCIVPRSLPPRAEYSNALGTITHG